MADQWYFARNGQQNGPVSFAQLQQLAARGELSPKDMVWTEGMANWAPAETIENLFARPQAATSAPGAFTTASAPGPSSAKWFYVRNGQQVGPVPFETLQQMASSGQLAPQELIWSEGMANWAPAQRVANLFPAGMAHNMPMAQAAPLAYQGQIGAPPPNYLVQSILVTLCCCLPFGIASIVYAAQVNSKFAAGDYQGAIAASESAKKWCWVSFILGLVANAIGLGLQILIGVNGR